MKTFHSLISPRTIFHCIGILLLALVGSVLTSAWPVRLAQLYTEISSGQISTLNQGILAICTFGGIYLAAEAITILRRILMDAVITAHESQVRQNSIEKLLRLPVSYNFGHNCGEKTARLNQGVAGLSQLIKILCNDVFSTILTAVCTLIQVFRNAPGQMVWVMLAYLVVSLAISGFQIRSQSGMREKIIGLRTKLDGNICQSISNLELIRSFHAEAYERRRLEPAVRGICEAERHHHTFMGTFDGLKQICKILFQMLILLFSIVLISQGKMAAGSVIAVCLLFQQLVKPIDEVYRFMDDITSSLVKAKILVEVFATEEDPVFSIQHHDSPAEDQNILLEDVVITEPHREKALAHYDHLVIPGNKAIALVGMSGCGKTTLVRCLDRFYPYTQGSVTLYGKDLQDYTQRELSDTICYLPQNTLFFSGTVRDNLVYGLEQPVSDHKLYDALKKACILDVLLDKAEEAGNGMTALNLEITEGGDNFSGGQRQRLTLARAFLRNPRLFILDESTANLDGENMNTILLNLKRHAAHIGAGILFISHDSRVTNLCDQVIQVNNLLNTASPLPSAAHAA